MQSYKSFLSVNSWFTSHLKLMCQRIFSIWKKFNIAQCLNFFLKGLKAKEIYEQLLEMYKQSSASKRTVEFWAGEFKRGRTRLEDDPRERRPKPQPHQKSLSKFIIMLMNIQV